MVPPYDGIIEQGHVFSCSGEGWCALSWLSHPGGEVHSGSLDRIPSAVLCQAEVLSHVWAWGEGMLKTWTWSLWEKLRIGQPFVIIILYCFTKSLKELFNFLIDPFCPAIHLQVKASGGCNFWSLELLRLHMKVYMNWVPQSLITSSGSLWSFQTWSLNSWATLDVVNIQCCQCGISTFGQMVNCHHDGIVSMAFEVVGDKINQNDFQQQLGMQLGMSFLVVGAGKVFMQLHRSQPFVLLCYVVEHPWPPEVERYQIGGLPSAPVAHDCRVVVGVHYVISELAIRGM